MGWCLHMTSMPKICDAQQLANVNKVLATAFLTCAADNWNSYMKFFPRLTLCLLGLPHYNATLSLLAAHAKGYTSVQSESMQTR